MIKKRPNFCSSFFKNRKAIWTCTLLADPPTNIVCSTASSCHCTRDQLIKRGFLSSLIKASPSISDALSVVDDASLCGVDLDAGRYAPLIIKLVTSGKTRLAEVLYTNEVVARGIRANPLILNLMVKCSSELGKLEDARNHLECILQMNCKPHKDACAALLAEFCAQDRILDAFRCLLQLSDAGAFWSFGGFNVLIGELCIRGFLDEALELFDILHEQSGCTQPAHLYKSLFYGLCKIGRVVEAGSIFIDMECNGMYIDKMMYTSLIREYCRMKNMKVAMVFFFRMLKSGCQPDIYTFNTLFEGFVKLGLFDKGWILLCLMQEWGLEPNGVTYHIMIRNYCLAGKVDCGISILKYMDNIKLSPSLHSYTVLISALYKQNRLFEVNEVWKTMLERCVIPDDVFCFVLMKMKGEGNELLLAYCILEAIANNTCGFKPPPKDNKDLKREIVLLLDIIWKRNTDLADVAFGVLISSLCEKGELREALKCLYKMLGLEIRPLLSTYNSLINTSCQLGCFTCAFSLIDCMQDQGIVPNQATYLIIIDKLCKRGDLKSAYEVLDQMDEMKLRPSVAIYNSILGCLCKEKRSEEAEFLFKRMLQSGLDPDEAVYTTMINCFSKSGKATKALELFEKMVENSIKPSSYSYTALISGLVKEGMIREACIYLDRMLGAGIEPNAVLYSSLINNFFKKGEINFAFRLIYSMEINQIEWDLITHITLAHCCCRNIKSCMDNGCVSSRKSLNEREMLLRLLHQKTTVQPENNVIIPASSEEMKFFKMKLIQKIEGFRLTPNLYQYNGIISVFCMGGNMQDAHGYFERMLQEGLCPNQVTYNIIIDGHIRCGDIDSAIWFFNKMNADGCAPDRVVYNTLLRGLAKTGRAIEALSLLNLMCKRGLYPNRISYDELLICFLASNLRAQAFRTHEEMVANKYMLSQYSQDLLKKIRECNRLHETQRVHDVNL